MKLKEKLAYIEKNHFGEWFKMRQVVEAEMSDKQSIMCVCGKLATGLHEGYCQRFKAKVNSETLKRLSHLFKK